jgi:hypothetical protein
VVYLLVVCEADKDFILVDYARPVLFAVSSIFQCGALFSISLMWADVYTKSVKMGKAGGKIVKLKKFINVMVIFSGLIVGLSFVIGASSISALYTCLIMIGLGITYIWAGKRLADILVPKDAKTGGAASAIAASNEIRRTSRALALYMFLFAIGLLGYVVTIAGGGQAAGALTWALVNLFLLSALGMQARIVSYIRFGNRKKLNKAGFKDGMKISWMKAMTSSVSTSVTPETEKAEGSGISSASSGP